METDISYRRIRTIDDAAKSGFLDLYLEAFSRPPYRETFTRDLVEKKIWDNTVPHRIIVAERAGQVVGLGCAHPVMQQEISPSTIKFIKDKNQLFMDTARTILISELATAKEYEGMGIASGMLVSLLLSYVPEGYRFFAARVSEGHEPAIKLLRNLEAKSMGEIQHIDLVEGLGISTNSHRRIILGGTTLTCLPRVSC